MSFIIAWFGLWQRSMQQSITISHSLNDIIIGFVLGIVEGLTEFIPVSSTGHLIVVGHWLGFDGDRADTFVIFIQLGAILAVVMLYRQRFLGLIPGNNRHHVEPSEHPRGFSGLRGLGLITLTTLPAAVVGVLIYDFIKDNLFSSATVAFGLALGGIVIIAAERRLPSVLHTSLDSLTWREALLIGTFQCLALWPGVSRSAATILGGMFLGLERKTAAEYSFLVAVPALLGAAGFDLIQNMDKLGASDIPLFAIGFGVSFVAAWLAIRLFLRLLAVVTLQPFGWYRIIAAGIVLISL